MSEGLWIDIDGELREPEQHDVAAYVWKRWHMVFAQREYLQAVASIGRAAQTSLDDAEGRSP